MWSNTRLFVVGCYLWVMMILFGSVVLETFMRLNWLRVAFNAISAAAAFAGFLACYRRTLIAQR